MSDPIQIEQLDPDRRKAAAIVDGDKRTSKLERTRRLTEDWHQIGAAGEPTFGGAFVNYGAGYAGAGFRRYADGTVELRGLVKTGTAGQTIFTLPAGYRPVDNKILATSSNDTYGQVRVDATTGNVILFVGSSVWASLDGLRFQTT